MYVFYLEKTSKMLVNGLTRQEISVSQNSVFFGYGIIKNDGHGWSGTNDFLYHIYFIPGKSF